MRRDSMNYNHYLAGDHWRSFRAKILRKWPKCLVCGKPSEVVHHVTYERLGAEWEMDVRALCHQCHDRLHVIHRERGIPYPEFSRAVEVMTGVKFDSGPGRMRNPRRPKDGSYWSQRNSIVRFMAIDLGMRHEIRRMMQGGSSAGEIARSAGWPSETVSFVVGYINHESRASEKAAGKAARKAASAARKGRSRPRPRPKGTG